MMANLDKLAEELKTLSEEELSYFLKENILPHFYQGFIFWGDQFKNGHSMREIQVISAHTLISMFVHYFANNRDEIREVIAQLLLSEIIKFKDLEEINKMIELRYED